MNNNAPHKKSSRPIFWITLAACIAAWGAILFWWFTHELPMDVSLRVPGMDGAPEDVISQDQTMSSIGYLFQSFDDPSSSIISAATTSSWPRFRGDGIDNISKENIPLADFSDGRIPPILWTIDLGEGHAAPAVRNGRVYVLDYDEDAEADMLRCFSLDDGRELWRRGYNIKVRRNHGMSRTVPAVTDSVVVTVGPMCHVMAAHAVSGDFLWGIDLAREYGTTVPLWYTGQCPLIDDTVAVIAPAGTRALMIGVDIRTGEVLWETPNVREWQMSHSSVIPMTFFGRRFYVYAASGGIVGVAADGDERGKILFETDEFNHSVIAPSPVAISGNRIFMTAGYGAGSAMFRVDYVESDDDVGDDDRDNDNNSNDDRDSNNRSNDDNSGDNNHTNNIINRRGKFSITLISRHNVREALASEQQTPLYYNGHLFAVLPKDAGAHRDQFVAVNTADVADIRWSSGQENLFGLGPFLIADNKFFILADDGVLTAARISTRTFERLGSVRITNGADAWGPMALVDGRLILRDSRRMFCVDLRRR